MTASINSRTRGDLARLIDITIARRCPLAPRRRSEAREREHGHLDIAEAQRRHILNLHLALVGFLALFHDLRRFAPGEGQRLLINM